MIDRLPGDPEPIRFAPPAAGDTSCIEPGCPRPPYIEERCKLHRDLHRYVQARAKERVLGPGARVLLRTASGRWITGTAVTGVQLEPRWGDSDGAGRQVVRVRVDGYESQSHVWTADAVELVEA